MQPRTISRENQQCIEDCLDCADICTRCATHCLDMGGEHASVEHQTLMQDCADICTVAARLMGRSSQHAAKFCGECAEICLACAEDCERLAGEDPMMKECAETCRTCAKACQQMAGAAV